MKINSLKEGSLLNARRIFQRDVNFDATSHTPETLTQSHVRDESGEFIIKRLPAIPADWSTGSEKDYAQGVVSWLIWIGRMAI